MQRHLDRVVPATQPVLVVGDNPNNPPGPRRQSTQLDWVHYYLGRWSTVRMPAQLAGTDLRAVPAVLVWRYDDRAAVMRNLGLRPIVSGREMVLAVADAGADAAARGSAQ